MKNSLVRSRFIEACVFVAGIATCASTTSAQTTAPALTPDQKVWELYGATKQLPLAVFNRALDAMPDTPRRSLETNFSKSAPEDKNLSVFDSYWTDQIAGVAILVASSLPDGGTVDLPQGPTLIHHGQYGSTPTYDQAVEAYWSVRPDGTWPGVHDPSPALKDGPYYYVFATAEGIPTLRSADRIHWRPIGPAFPAGHQPAWWQQYQPAHVKKDPKTHEILSSDFNPNVFLWAPHVVRYNGQYHLYYAIPSSFGIEAYAAIGHATKSTLDPAVPWKDDGKAVVSCEGKDTFNTIDPSFVVDRDGNPWMPFGSFSKTGIHLVPLDKETGALKAGAQKPWPNIAGDGMESPTVYFNKQNDRYYLLTSEGFGIGPPWDYKVRVWRTEAGAPVTGPYMGTDGRRALDATNQIGRGEKNNNPGMILIGAKGDRIAPGGEALFTDDADGKLYMIFHERDNSQWVHPKGMGPLPMFNLQIREVTFDDAGWPMLGPATLPTPDETMVTRPAIPPAESR